MSLTSVLGLKAIPLCVNETGKVTVKVHVSQPAEPEVTQVSGMFNLHQVTLAGCCASISSLRVEMGSVSAVLMCVFPSFFSISEGLKYLEEIKFNKCIYIEDSCLERLSSIENLQESLYMMEVVSCGNVTDKGIIALHKLR